MISNVNSSHLQAITLPINRGVTEHSADENKTLSEDKTEQGRKPTEKEPAAKPNKELDTTEQRQVSQLQQRDQEVRAHETAHLAAAGALAMGGASFSFQQGPDGQRYAIGGDVSINIATIQGDPEATLVKSEKIRQAALAPAQPSSQDVSVAAMATRMGAEARTEILQQRFAPSDKENNRNAIESYQSNTDEAASTTESQLNTFA